MALTAAGEALTVAHGRAQLQIRAFALRDWLQLWPLWTGDATSFAQLVGAAIPLVRAHRDTSSSLAASYFDAFRAAEGVSGRAGARLAPALDVQQVTSSLYVTGEVMTRNALAAGQSPQAAMHTALVRTSGAVTRHVLDGGRATMLGSVEADRQARGYQRVTVGSKVCAFCAMLAGRGPVYRSEQTADFRAHDHCTCGAEPVYGNSALPPASQHFRQAYNAATAAARDSGDLDRGTSNDLLNAFRRELDSA